MSIQLTSGFGFAHTNDADAEKPYKKLTPYASIDFEGIRRLVDTPQRVAKAQAQWVIPSSYASRTFKAQEQHGEFWMLWADLDKEPLTIEALNDGVETLGDFDYEIYSSRSATLDNQRARLLIPLDQPLSGAQWLMAQDVINDKLTALGATPDTSNLGCAQLCYLPNAREFYQSASRRLGNTFNPLLAWSGEFAAKQREIEAQEQAIIAARSAAQARRAEIVTRDYKSIIEAFNAAYSVHDILDSAGYANRGNTYRHPASESGSFSASVKDGRVHSLSSNDPLYTGGGGVGAHDAFSAFQVLFAGGDRNEAMKLAGDQWLTIGSESWNKVQQRNFMQTKDLIASEHLPFLDQHTPPLENNVIGLGEFLSEMRVPCYVWQGIIQKNHLYAITANPGSGKTAISLALALAMTQGLAIHGRETMQCRVLYLCGENPDDVRLRFLSLMIEHDISQDDVEGKIFFTKRPFHIDDNTAREQFLNDARLHAPYDVVFIDTVPAHSSIDDENDNSKSHALAITLRAIGETIGEPCILALMHPVKGAGRDNLLPRGGSALTGSVDGVICIWRDNNQSPSEMFAHKGKFRGNWTDSFWFDLKSIEHRDMRDNFGYPASSVVALECIKDKNTEAVDVDPILMPTVKEQILTFIHYMTSRGDWVGDDWSAPNSNNICKKTHHDFEQFPSMLKLSDGKRLALKAIDSLKSDGMLIKENREVPNKTGKSKRDRSAIGLWLTPKALESLAIVSGGADQPEIAIQSEDVALGV